MFLKSLELFGFKSFADRTRFDFSDGITSLLGPNGSGKSNVVDSIKWVLGTQALSAVRAGKREDVIFNGTDNRKSMPMCEVILTINNEENLLNIQASEVEIKRRMFRNGENEYFINRERVLLRSVKDLFMDTGVGKAAYSILEQGKIDQILSLKAEDRRYVFEEAAGISKFKSQSEEASRKLQRTDENIMQVQTLMKSIKGRYETLKTQVEKVSKYKSYKALKEQLEGDLQLSYVQAFTKFQAEKKNELVSLQQEANEIDSRMQNDRDYLGSKQEELDLLRQKRDDCSSLISRLEEKSRGLDREIQLLDERFSDVKQRKIEAKSKAQTVQDRLNTNKQNLEAKQAQLDETIENIDLTKKGIDKASKEIVNLRADNAKRKLDVEDLEIQSEELAEKRLEITESISALANEIANQLEEQIHGSGYSSAVRAKTEKAFFAQLGSAKTVLNERINFLQGLLDTNFEKGMMVSALEDAFESLASQLDEIKGLFQEYSGTIPSFIDEFISPEGTITKKTALDNELSANLVQDQSCKDKTVALKEEIERCSRNLILKESDLNDLLRDEASFRSKAELLKSSVNELKEAVFQMEFEFSDASKSIESEESKVNEIIEKIDAVKTGKEELANIIESKREELEDLRTQITEKSADVDSRNAEFQQQFERRQALIGQIATSEANLQNLAGQIQKVYTDYFENTGKSLREIDNHEVTQPVEDLKTELDKVKKNLNDLGFINHMAEDEFAEVKKNYDFYTTNLADLDKARTDLQEVITQIKTKSQELFLATYSQISEAFEEMFCKLFGGGKAHLSLTDMENPLESGIEIMAQPPGKKLTHLPLLSGGEKSMTAVALLFATYKVKPSPFCILDEIDAALDDRNIGAFLSVLEQFGEKSQFIIITHNKHTVMGSSTLLGITQQELGVSKMIGYKLESDKNFPGIYETLK